MASTTDRSASGGTTGHPGGHPSDHQPRDRGGRWGEKAHGTPGPAATLVSPTPPTTPASTGASGNTTARFTGSSKSRQEIGLPGHCEDCATLGHVAAHPDLGCGDVGCHSHHDQEPVRLATPEAPTRQTDRPLERLSAQATDGTARGLAQQADDGDLELAPPYQRGSVWTEEQRVNLIRSLRIGLPIPPVVLNDRHTAAWQEANGLTRDASALRATYAVVDGKQRIETLRAWFNGDLAVPASWFPDDEFYAVHVTDDGPYVTWNDLTPVGRTRMGTEAKMPRVIASVDTVEAEADLYLLLNGAGTAQTDDDMANAARIAARLDGRP